MNDATKGRCAIASKPFYSNQFLCEYAGELIDQNKGMNNAIFSTSGLKAKIYGRYGN